jgi:hypothetical protein
MDRLQFIDFLSELRTEYLNHPEIWENKNIDDYLEAMIRYSGDIQGYYDNTGQNIDGTPDKRFMDNHQIPICQYGEISITSETGLNEAYHISSFDKSSQFAEQMMEYQQIIKR